MKKRSKAPLKTEMKKDAKLDLKEETPGDGNCWIHAILNQMKYVYIYISVNFLHYYFWIYD